MGFEPTRGDPIGLAGRSLSRSAKVSDGLAELQADIVSSWAVALLASRSVVKEGPLFSADSMVVEEAMVLLYAHTGQAAVEWGQPQRHAIDAPSSSGGPTAQKEWQQDTLCRQTVRAP